MDDKNKQKAEGLIWYKKFDEAETIYRDMDRKDLALDMRVKLGDWFKVVQLIQQGAGNDDLLALAWKQIGSYYCDRCKQDKAIDYNLLANAYTELVELYFVLEDFERMEKLVDMVPEDSPLLVEIGEKFENAGLCSQAVRAFVRAKEIKRAVDCCVLLNQWNTAVEMAEKYNFHQIDSLLNRYATHLMEHGKKMEAVELQRKAHRNTEAAKILSDIAKDLAQKGINYKMIKKIQVLAAFEVESYKKRLFEATMSSDGDAASMVNRTLDTLITTDISTSTDKALDNPWRSAEAQHFLMLCQNQLHSGEWDASLKTCIRLTEQENIIGTKLVYSLVALSSYQAQCFSECSKAFVKLENMDTTSRNNP